MTKRLSRYHTQQAIQAALPNLIGEKIHLVLVDGRVFYVVLDKFDNDVISYRNMRLKKQHVNLAEVTEVIVDY